MRKVPVLPPASPALESVAVTVARGGSPMIVTVAMSEKPRS
jgi:hypothetical protein